MSVIGWYRCWNKSKGSDNKDSCAKSQEYDDINIPHLLNCENNPSYKQVQHSKNKDPQMSSASCPLYEDPDKFLHVKMDPVTQSSKANKVATSSV